jgi:hypothetical protein
MEQPSKNSLITLFVGLVVIFFVVGCASAIKPGEESGKATTRNYLFRHGIDGTLINVEFRGSKAFIVAAEVKRGWKSRIGESAEFKNVVMAEFSKMKSCDLLFPSSSITWNFNEDGTCTIWGNQRDNPAENGRAFPVEGPTLEWLPDLTEGLVAHYFLNGNAKDESSHRLHGTLEGPLPTTDRAGVDGAALNFDGASNSMKVPHSDVLNIAGGLTISTWLKPNPLKQTTILTKGSHRDNRDDYSLAIIDKKLQYAWSNNTDQVWAYTNDELPVKPNRWLHIVVVHQSSISLAIYVNGELMEHTLNAHASEPTSIEVTRGRHNRSLWLGIDPDHEDSSKGARFHYGGAMDDLRIYNRTLTTEEIKALYEIEKP